MKAFASWNTECEAMAELWQRSAESGGVSDPGIPTLEVVFDPATMETYLREVLPDLWGAIENIEFQVLKHHPGSRCTFEISSRTTNGWYCLIGKVYAADRFDVYRAMNEIRRAGFGSEDEFSIPKPLAYIPGLRLLLQEKVQGPRAKQFFLAGNERDRVEASERCARWLAKFHAVAPQSGEVLDPTGQMDSIAKWSRTIAELGEPLAGLAGRVSKRLEERAAAVANGMELRAGHGSYSCHQVILSDGRTIAFDWDAYDVADPCQDVARFLVALQRLAFKYLGSIRALDTAAEVFLKTYQGLSRFRVAANLPWYRALTCLRLSKYEANRPVCTFRKGIEVLLGEALRILEQ
jgi:hypothetical protein